LALALHSSRQSCIPGRDTNQPVDLSATVNALASRSFKEKHGMTDAAGISGNRILSFIERVEHIDEELKALIERKKEVFSEAKGEGFDVKVLKEILRMPKQNEDERDEQDSLFDLNMRSIQAAETEQAKAA
jgi:uncharacterized protein (UPF0335 family)